MRLSYNLLSYIANLGDQEAVVARKEYLSLEKGWAQAHHKIAPTLRPHQHLEVFFVAPDLFVIHDATVSVPQRHHTLTGVPMASRTSTMPGIPLSKK